MPKFALLTVTALLLSLSSGTLLASEQPTPGGAPSSPVLGSPAGETNCNDDVDNDLDGCTDATDVDCGGTDATCDELDDNCNGTADEDAATSTWYADVDSDSYGNAGSSMSACSQPSGHVANSDDCDDVNPIVHPGAVEICGNGIDDDCDTAIDDDGTGASTWYADADSDTYGDAGSSMSACSQPSGHVASSDDCDDADPSVHPGATEVCNGIDDDCNTFSDENNPGGNQVCATGQPGICDAGTTQCSGGAIICNANESAVTESCNGLDDDCDGSVDQGNPDGGAVCDSGQPGVCAPGTMQCDAGGLSCAADVTASPESCNGQDDNCDGSVDEGNPDGGAVCDTGLPDSCAPGTEQCVEAGIVCVADASSVPEDCNGADDDCDGSIDEDNPGGGAQCDTGKLGDCSYGVNECLDGEVVCTQQTSPILEYCDGQDNDCDGFEDEGWDEDCYYTFSYCVDFGPATTAPEYGCVRDSGRPFDLVTGVGWHIPPTSQLQRRERSCDAAEHEQTFVFSQTEKTWELDLFGVMLSGEDDLLLGDFTEPMDFEVAVTIGDCDFRQGPQRVTVEGVPFFEDEITQTGQFVRRVRAVRVPDGRLTVTIGGGAGHTVINSIEVTPAELQPENSGRINFQPESVDVPPGFAPDYGYTYDDYNGFGWESYQGTNARSRARNADPVLDSLIFSSTPAVWEGELPDGLYDVWAVLGDARYAQGPHRVVVEGATVLEGETTAPNEFIQVHAVSRVSDGRLTLEIGGGGGNTTLNYVTAATIVPSSVHVNFQPEFSKVPEGYEPDWGLPFDADRGYGWSSWLTSRTRDRGLDPDPRIDTLIHLGAESQTWEVAIADGDYQVHLSVGDAQFVQGPHWVTVEGTVFFDGQTTPAGQFLEATMPVTVRDGRLSVDVGGGKTGFTTINYIDIVRLDERAAINFQPEASAVPDGYAADSGRVYDAERGYGWDDDALFQLGRSRERGVVSSPVLDTFVFADSTARHWQHDLPSGDYFVTFAVGDAVFAQGPQRVVLEGDLVVDDETTAAGEFLTRSVCVTVEDDQLDLEVGGAAAHTTINYLTVRGATCPETQEVTTSIVAPQRVAGPAPGRPQDLRPLD